MRNRQFKGLRQEDRNAIAARKSLRRQHIGKAARMVGDLIETRARRGAVLVDVDQRKPARAVRVTVATGGRKIEARWNLPAEVAVELVVGCCFGEHRNPPSWPGKARRASLHEEPRPSTFFLIAASFKRGNAPAKPGHDGEDNFCAMLRLETAHAFATSIASSASRLGTSR